ncbi:MAG TPA: DNA mismatch repair endonuclease MutH [Polyangiaceae bacterium]|nr:DNA mismatch repair endonuclease MutH [Polyangiaceae bacterium]
MTVGPPASETELLQRARALAGVSLGEIALQVGAVVPETLLRAKGWVGMLVEKALGASAGSRAEPDFPALRIELKTLPIDASGTPRESTFVCTVELSRIPEIEWHDSRVKKKLERVLWFPVQADREIPMHERRLGEPLLWFPAPEEEAALRFDWEELAGRIACFGTESVTAHLGQHLQVRPKAAHSRIQTRVVDGEGEPYAANPRGFYLRTTFTDALLRKHYTGMR